MKTDRVIAGLDIGSTKVTVIIGKICETGVDVVGVGTAQSAGLRRGTVVNIESTTAAIQKAREEAELMAGCQIENVWLGVSGAHIQSFDSKGIVAIRNSEVTTTDVERVIEAAKTVAVPADRTVLHVLPRDYKIDEQDGIGDPIGMSGVRLEASVHIVTGSQTAVQNILKCTERAAVKIAGLVLEPLASAMSVLTEDEKNLGVAHIDMGGGTTDLIIYARGSVAYTASIPLGGSHVTNDVALGLRTSYADAENLKKKYGCALSSLINDTETIEVEGVGGRKERTVLRRYLCEVIEPRVEEILTFANNEIQKSGFAGLLGAGVVLTGGGSLIDGLPELGEFVFDLPVRRATPGNFGGLTEAVKSPAFATAIGLLHFGAQQAGPVTKKSKGTKAIKENTWVNRVKGFIDGVFSD